MKRILFLGLATASLALTACGSADEASNAAANNAAEANVQEAAPKQNQPMTEAQVQAEIREFQDSVEKAMAEIPPQHREQFQKLFACEIEKNSRRNPQQDINAATIRALTAQLNQNPRAGDTCA